MTHGFTVAKPRTREIEPRCCRQPRIRDLDNDGKDPSPSRAGHQRQKPAGKCVQLDFSRPREQLIRSLPVKMADGQGRFQAGASGTDEHSRLELSDAVQGHVDVQGLVDLINAAQPGWIQWDMALDQQPSAMAPAAADEIAGLLSRALQRM